MMAWTINEIIPVPEPSLRARRPPLSFPWHTAAKWDRHGHWQAGCPPEGKTELWVPSEGWGPLPRRAPISMHMSCLLSGPASQPASKDTSLTLGSVAHTVCQAMASRFRVYYETVSRLSFRMASTIVCGMAYFL